MNLQACCDTEQAESQIIPIEKFSCFQKLLNVLANVFKFVHILKTKVKLKSNFIVPEEEKSPNFHKQALNHIIKVDQSFHFKKLLEYFHARPNNISSIPNLINQLNVCIDSQGILRVYSKFGRKSLKSDRNNPILLSKNSALTTLIIQSNHVKMAHVGRYTLLSELRNNSFCGRKGLFGGKDW